MAVAEKTSPDASQEKAQGEQVQEKTWYGIVQQTLKRNEIRLVPYVPDRVLTTLIKNLHADPFFDDDEAGRTAVTVNGGTFLVLTPNPGDFYLAFFHDLTYEGVRSSVPVSVRRALDRQAATVLLELGALPIEVALQLASSAEPGD